MKKVWPLFTSGMGKKRSFGVSLWNKAGLEYYYKAKENWMNKKRAAGLVGNVEKVEVVIVVREAMINSFNNTSHAKKALTLRGWNPPNFACLDDPDILESAPADVNENRV